MNKDKEWLKEQLQYYKEAVGEPFNSYSEGLNSAYGNVERLIDQLEEPETLSQEWIDENQVIQFYEANDTADYFVRSTRLQNLLVPKQELPAIPKFVADWYESEGKRSSWWNWFYKWGRDESRSDLESKTIKWMQDYNEEKFVDMFLHGYKVEEEQKYTVSSPKEASGFWFLSKNKDGEVVVGTNKDYFDYGWDALKLTEQEIKEYDERYWVFAEEVTEWPKKTHPQSKWESSRNLNTWMSSI